MFDQVLKPLTYTFHWLPCIALMLANVVMHAQAPAQYQRLGEQAVDDGNWQKAFSYFQQGYDLDTTSFDLAVHYAHAARQLRYYELAEKLYRKTYEKDNGLLHADGLYWLAKMQKYNGKYEDAQRNFKSYIKKFKQKGTRELIQRAEQEFKSAVWAMEHSTDISNDTVVPMSHYINTNDSETSPFPLGDTLYFARGSESTEGVQWQTFRALMVDSSLKKIDTGSFPYPISNACVIGESVFFSATKDRITKLYNARLEGTILVAIRELEELNATGTINTMPHGYTTTDGNRYILFCSNRENGEGGMDIWYAKLTKQTNWSSPQFEKPKNIGRQINSPGDELSPTVYEGKLYFSSDWHNGFGGQDIFSCNLTGITASQRENMGLPINSSYNDFYYIRQKKNAFFTSNRGADSESTHITCCNDIFRIDFNESTTDTLVTDTSFANLAALNEVLPVTLYFHNDEPNPKTLDTTTTLSYLDAYQSYLQLESLYIQENTRGLNGRQREEAEAITQDFFEYHVRKGRRDLALFSRLLIKELQEGHSIHVTVRGFASPRAKTEYNLNLTKRRTESFVNYLERDSAGIFDPYIQGTASNGAVLTFELLPFGEYKASKSISDDLQDTKNSIYGRSACMERKIEIQSVTRVAPKPTLARIALSEVEYNFGKINNRDRMHHTFYITNISQDTLRLDSVIAECGCTEPKLDKHVLLPQEKTGLHVGFDPLGKRGKQKKSITLYIAGEKPRELFILSEIE